MFLLPLNNNILDWKKNENKNVYVGNPPPPFFFPNLKWKRIFSGRYYSFDLISEIS